MAWPDQTVTVTAVATGHLVLRVRDNSVSTSAGAPLEIGRIIDVSDVETGKSWFDLKGYNADGTKQTVERFANEVGSGKFRVTLDEVPDLDDVSWLGEQLDVAIKQAFTKGSDVAWRLLAAKATIDIVSAKPNMDSPTTVVVEITPYQSPGTAPWAFETNYDVS